MAEEHFEAKKPHMFVDDCIVAMKLYLVRQGLPWDVVDDMGNAFVLHNFSAYVDRMERKNYFPPSLLFK